MDNRYNEPHKGKLDLRSEVLALLDSLNCTYKEAGGILYVKTLEGYTWDMTLPKERSAQSFVLTCSCGAPL
jgi:hypothetical protein